MSYSEQCTLPEALAPLIALPHWVIWRWETNKNGKQTKVPYQAAHPSRHASSTDPNTWSDYATAVDAAVASADGIGFCLFNSKFAAFDVDDCRDPDTGAINPWAAALVKRSGSYAEITPSGAGIRIVGMADGQHIHRKIPVAGSNVVSVELFRRAKRYITVTGDQLPGSPSDLAKLDMVMDDVLAELDDASTNGRTGSGEQRRHSGIPRALLSLLHLKEPGEYPSRSELLFAFIGGCLRKRIADETVIDACLNETFVGCAIFEHVREQKGRPYVERQIAHARGKKSCDDDVAPAFSEEALALDFAKRYAHELRHVAAWGKWFYWDGTCWRIDETRKVFSLARALCRETAAAINKPNERRRVASAKTRAAVVSLAGEDRRLAAAINQWDADPWLLNTPGGVVDLRTGGVRAHRCEDYMTKITAFAPGSACPKWKEFIAKVTGGDEKLAAYLARICGYALTGSIGEHALFFLFGLGQNGKSVFLIVISGVVGDYYRPAPIEMFSESQTDRHPTELAMLMGARLVTAVEPEEGRRWSETRIKQLTGGDKIPARFMRQDFFEYTPQFKLFIAGNHKPGLRSVDKAIARRMNIIPFAVTIPDAEKIKDLAEILLKDEGPGILQWMIKGCLDWQKNGLAPPDAVTVATKKYLADQNVLLTWLNERCVRDPQATTPSSLLYADWKGWAEQRNEFVGSNKSFTQRMEALGLEGVKRDTDRDGAKWIGIKLIDPATYYADRATARVM
jgi:putative DNA primase/helicase